MSHKKLERKSFAQSVRKITPENEYWNGFSTKYEDKLHLNIPFLRFSSNSPYDCVVCSHFDVRIFKRDPLGFVCRKKLGFKSNPLVADIRADNKLLAVAGKNGLFRIYNNSNASGLQSIRALNGHFGDINDVRFDPLNSTKIVSFGSDKTFGYWDIVSAKRVVAHRAHNDSIRSGDWLTHTSNSTIMTASYDHHCKVWDLKSQSQSCVATFNHNLPIESCVAIPNSDLIAIAGGPRVSIWSLRKADKAIKSIAIHRKTVTDLCVNAAGTRLLTACLDHYCRVFKIDSEQSAFVRNTHSFIAQSAVLSVDISRDNKRIAFGTLNHGIAVRQMKKENSQIIKKGNINPQSSSLRGQKDWVLRGQKVKNNSNCGIGLIVKFKSKKSLTKYEIALTSFRYSDALDLALLSGDTLTVYSVCQDLWRRDGLEIALGGRDHKRLMPVLEYLVYSLPHPHLTQLSLHITACIIDEYQSVLGLSNEIDHLFKTISQIIKNIVTKYQILLKLSGSVESILAAQDIIANK